MEAEQSVLGGLLLDNEAWFDIVEKIGEDDFYTHDHRLIFRAISEVVTQNKPCDFVTLSEHLRHQNKLEEAGGLAYLGMLAADTPSAANVRAYAGIVKERSVLRSLIAAGNLIADLGYRPDGRGPGELVDTAEQQIFKIRESGSRGQSDWKAMPELMEIIQQRVISLRNNPQGVAGLPTGFVELDRMTTGLHAGDLVIVAGRPSMGKTSFAMNIAEHVALIERKGVGVFSMEMSAEQLALRVLSSFGRIDQQLLRKGELSDLDMSRLISQAGLIAEAPLYIDETGGLAPLELRARARRMKARHDIQLIVVDYLQLMQVPGSKENRTNEISEISRSMKGLAKELSVPIIALSQLNRSLEQRDNKRPRMSDLRESGSIEQDADMIAFIYRDEVYNKESMDKGIAEIIIGKQRNGPIGTVRTAFLGQYTRFDNLADPSYQNY
jgi:replicative DNA helicase